MNNIRSIVFKNGINSLIFLLLTFVLSSCNNHYTIIENTNILYGKVRYITEFEYRLSYRFGELQKDKPSAIRYYWFDERQNLIKKKEISQYSISDSVIYEYNSDNCLVKKVDFFDKKKVTTVYDYNSNYLTRSTSYINDSLVESVTYEFSESFKKQKEIHVTGNLMKVVICKFDNNKNKISQTYYDNEGQQEKEYLFEYNHCGLLIKSHEYLTSGQEYSYEENNFMKEKKDAFSHSKHTYSKIDKHDNWLEQQYFEEYTNQSSSNLIERVITYYE